MNREFLNEQELEATIQFMEATGETVPAAALADEIEILFYAF